MEYCRWILWRVLGATCCAGIWRLDISGSRPQSEPRSGRKMRVPPITTHAMQVILPTNALNTSLLALIEYLAPHARRRYCWLRSDAVKRSVHCLEAQVVLRRVGQLAALAAGRGIQVVAEEAPHERPPYRLVSYLQGFVERHYSCVMHERTSDDTSSTYFALQVTRTSAILTRAPTVARAITWSLCMASSATTT